MRSLKHSPSSSMGPPGSRGTAHRANTFTDPLVINDPRVGVLNLLSSADDDILTDDRAKLAPLFASYSESRDSPPLCDVLLLYCQIESGGHIAGTSDGLRDLIQRAKAPIAIVASENPAENYLAASKDVGRGRANLVMTLNRKGLSFAAFFQNLFMAMKHRKSMPMAWVELAPQISGQAHPNCPECIFVCELGHIVFNS